MLVFDTRVERRPIVRGEIVDISRISLAFQAEMTSNCRSLETSCCVLLAD